MLKKLHKILESSYLCIKYPFLYPRNRFDDKHHVYLLNDLRYRLRKDAYEEIFITGHLDKEDIVKDRCITFSDKLVVLCKGEKKLIISNNIEEKEIDLSKLIWGKDKFKILGISLLYSYSNTPVIKVHVKLNDESDTSNYGFSYERVELVKSHFKRVIYNTVKWIDGVLDKICFIPTYTELDSMPDGWRKAFGLQMCEEIKQAILKSGGRKYLKEYRILQIKEKYGTLRWYDNYSTKEVMDIVLKYEDLSYNTCISCGKPATKISSGWICPYCDECFSNETYPPYMEKVDGKWVEVNESL